jgi:hypothetical protein
MSETQKPIKRHHLFAYDYHECSTYLQARDGYDERDYAGTFQGHPDAPYQDFWHFVLDKDCEIRNHSVFVMYESWRKEAEPWQQEILLKYLETFGERDDDGERFIEFYVWW